MQQLQFLVISCNWTGSLVYRLKKNISLELELNHSSLPDSSIDMNRNYNRTKWPAIEMARRHLSQKFLRMVAKKLHTFSILYRHYYYYYYNHGLLENNDISKPIYSILLVCGKLSDFQHLQREFLTNFWLNQNRQKSLVTIIIIIIKGEMQIETEISDK